jgi:hypothetical protein
LCCTGFVYGSAYGHVFKDDVKCKFLNNNCTIYETRPEGCKGFNCFWLLEMFPEEWKPNIVNFLGYEINSVKYKFYKFIFKNKFDDSIFLQIDDFCKKNKMPYVVKYEEEWFIHGTDDFKKHIKINSEIFLKD